MLFNFIVWPLWLFFLIGTIVYIPSIKMAMEASGIEINSIDFFSLLAFCVSAVAILEAVLTVAIRRFAIIKPVKQGTLLVNTFNGRFRYLLVHLINWIIIQTIPIYGIVLYIISQHIVFVYVFAFAGLGLMVFHSPLFTRHAGESITIHA